MKWSILALAVAFCASCTNQTVVERTVTTDTNLEETMQKSTQESNQTSVSILENTEKEKLNQALALAIENKDYRLQATSTRSINIPGVHPKNYQAMIALCGKKYTPNTGDVIRSEEERLARKKELNFMRQYNERMITICQEKSSQ